MDKKKVNAPNQLKIMNLVTGERENHLVKDGEDTGSGMVPAGRHELI